MGDLFRVSTKGTPEEFEGLLRTHFYQMGPNSHVTYNGEPAWEVFCEMMDSHETNDCEIWISKKTGELKFLSHSSLDDSEEQKQNAKTYNAILVSHPDWVKVFDIRDMEKYWQ